LSDFTSLRDQVVQVRKMLYGLLKRVAPSEDQKQQKSDVPTY